jgi:vancomycin resistance protein YoaR
MKSDKKEKKKVLGKKPKISFLWIKSFQFKRKSSGADIDKGEIVSKELKHRAKIVFLSVCAIITLFLVAFGSYSLYFSKKIFPNQYLAGQRLMGMSHDSLVAMINEKTSLYASKEITLSLVDNDKKFSLPGSAIGLKYDIDKTSNDIWSMGRRTSIAISAKEQFLILFNKKNYTYSYLVDDALLKAKIAEISAAVDLPEKDLTFTYSDDTFVLLDERKAGSRINQAKIIGDINTQIATADVNEIKFVLESFSPQITEESANSALAEANKILASGEVVLKNGTEQYKVDLDTIGALILPKANGTALEIAFNDDRAAKYVAALAKNIDREPQSSKLKIIDGKVSVFQPSKNGATLDQTKTISEIKTLLLSRISEVPPTTNQIDLAIAEKKPEVSDTDVSALGINELVGTAYTNFKGSSANRIHNITVGAASLNGVILKPGEEFSTLAHLGTIDASTGYLEELVIKENRTTPEFGGGLCQVSSTLFRSALNAGLKITERQNHKYRVSYYEPPVGMDATIYDPAPDFKFVNNYNSHILIQSKIEGTKITFEVYGTKDSRKIEISTPVLSDYTNPEPPLMVETDTLPVGQKKQIEKAHQGVTASFDYKVTATDGTILQTRTFKSKYVPWQERWLVGTGGATPANCSNGIQDGDETAIDSGGSCPVK